MPANLMFDNGLVTVRDPSTLAPGELAIATGCEYRVGTSHLHKIPGRSSAGDTTESAAVDGVGLLIYETGDSKVVAVVNGKVYEATPGSTLTFDGAPTPTPPLTGLTAGAVPWFTSYADQWIMVNATDDNYIREPNGNWRTLGMVAPPEQTTVTTSAIAGTAIRPTAGGNFSQPNAAVDADGNTYAMGAATTDAPTITETYTFGAETLSGYYLYVTYSTQGVEYSGTTAARDSTFPERGQEALPPSRDVTRSFGNILVEYTLDATAGTPVWVELANNNGTNKTTATVAIPDAAYLAGELAVRVTVTFTSGEAAFKGLVYDVRLNDAASTAVTVVNGLYYFVTERYTDADGKIHESAPTNISDKVSPGDYALISVNLPTQVNTFADEYVVYRSLDTEAGGYPFLYEVGTIGISASTWPDDFSYSLSSPLDKTSLFDFITVLYPDGSQLDFPINVPPPKSKFALPYQGSMVYIPVDIPRRVYYSIPANLSSVGLEQVPDLYYLEFLTPRNDIATTAAVTNGGRSLLVYFPAYTMLVTSLPQASDPQRFDNRIREEVSNIRGSAGRLTATSFTPDDGITVLAASVDSLGLWVTDGVGFIRSSSDDLDWSTLMSGVDLTIAQLIDNPVMSRLELLYLDGSQYKELHFFYGQPKENGQPKITGPHTVGFKSKTWGNYNGTWFGWTGDDGDGIVYYERGQASDASNAEDSAGTVTFDVQTGDIYDQGLGRASLIEFGYPKFEINLNKTLRVRGTFRRDGYSTAQSIDKDYNAGTQKKFMIHRYADRHRIRFTDATNTAMPALVAYTYSVRDAGDARDR